ncbi:MAG: peptidoglycan DD-metalloendopeptidase family protein [Synergistaceae bacterium]|jgi:murein DD-endopeptidase MepM/ murein hydrolase activator NlpD|nr:peptidoglycan DD-metalloendopeptidase family protein [Synergistaceae bacterium]
MSELEKRQDKRIFMLIVSVLVSAAFFAGRSYAAAQSPNADNINNIEKELASQQKRLDTMEREIKKNNAKLKDAKKKEERAINDISKLSNQLAEAEQRLNVTELKRLQITKKLTETTAGIKKTESRIARAKKLLEERVIAVYKYGGAAEFSLLMSASGTQDALDTSYMLTRIAEQDKALIDNLISEKNTMDKAKAELEKQRKELERRNEEIKKQKASIQKTTNERNSMLQQARKDKAMFLAEQDELLKASMELKSKVNDLLARKKRDSGKGGTPLYYKGGKFAWPHRGNVTSPYGTRTHPVFKTKTTHTGIDIDGNKGDPVRAAADGEVLYTGWLRGYGQVVVIDHGGNLTSVYAHLSGIDTAENAKVKTGDRIGRVGSTGVTTGAHLHFEVRVNGNTQDPMKYLRR